MEDSNPFKFPVDCGEHALTLQAADMMEATAWEPFFLECSFVLQSEDSAKV